MGDHTEGLVAWVRVFTSSFTLSSLHSDFGRCPWSRQGRGFCLTPVGYKRTVPATGQRVGNHLGCSWDRANPRGRWCWVWGWFSELGKPNLHRRRLKVIIIIIIINPLTAKVVGAPQMILQPVFSIFPCSPLPSGTCWTPGLTFPWCCLPTSSSACLVFFPLSLCLARRFWPDLMNGRHDHTTAVCASLRSSGGLLLVQLPAGSWHVLPRC